MSVFLYNFFIRCLNFAIAFSSIWSPKSRLWIRGRRDILKQVVATRQSLAQKVSRTVWMHCASLGEFEQGRPIIEQLKKTEPQTLIVITFFSPSGYEVRKNYTGADLVFYLPSDKLSNVKKFLDIIQPTLVIWVRYEFWHNYLQELKRREIPVVLISALFRRSQPFFKVYGDMWRKTLKSFTHIFVQKHQSINLLEGIGIVNVSMAGDTRFDRVYEIAAGFEDLGEIKGFVERKKTLIAGSTWPEDEEGLIKYINQHPQYAYILAPHEVGAGNINRLQRLIKNSVLYSQYKKTDDRGYNTMIINNVGMLSRLYHYADVTYVGGGFGHSGLHNILEAAVYGKPVLFGPHYEKHYEASELIEQGGGITVNSSEQLASDLDCLWQNQGLLQEKGNAARTYVMENRGATNIIMNYIYKNLL